MEPLHPEKIALEIARTIASYSVSTREILFTSENGIEKQQSRFGIDTIVSLFTLVPQNYCSVRITSVF